MESLYVIKIGGNIIDDDKRLSSFLTSFASVKGKKILVHGGGKLATKMAADLSLPQQMVDGRRVTNSETLKLVTMVYTGWINKNIVAQLQATGCRALGLCGADANIITAHKRPADAKGFDFGWVGDVDAVNNDFLTSLFNSLDAVVVAPITHDGQGNLLNTNADTIAQEIAKAMSTDFEVNLIYSFEKAGVLSDVNDEASVIHMINPAVFKQLKEEKKIFEGMLPKLDNAFAALQAGVHQVIIGKAENLQALIASESGTSIVNE